LRFFNIPDQIFFLFDSMYSTSFLAVACKGLLAITADFLLHIRETEDSGDGKASAAILYLGY
jgi:hypothetical protein